MSRTTKATAGERRYPIQVVSRRTGISPDALRAWERRYGAVVPHRSTAQRRLYSDADIERLTLLRRAAESGHGISRLAELPDDALRALLVEDVAAAVGRRDVAADTETAGLAESACRDALKAVRKLDSARLHSVFNQASLALGPGELIEHVFFPLMRTVGDLWHQGRLGIAHEHLATAIVRGALSEFALSRRSSNPGPSIVVATPAGQRHELGALAVAATANSTGWHVTYLGADVPAADLADAVLQSRSRAIALSIMLPDDAGALTTALTSLRDQLPAGTVLIAGGRGTHTYVPALTELGVLVLDDMPSLRTILTSLRYENGR